MRYAGFYFHVINIALKTIRFCFLYAKVKWDIQCCIEDLCSCEMCVGYTFLCVFCEMIVVAGRHKRNLLQLSCIKFLLLLHCRDHELTPAEKGILLHAQVYW